MRYFLLLSALLYLMPVVAQNTCQSAPVINFGQYQVDTIAGNANNGDDCASGEPGENAIWYAIYPTQDTFITISTDLPATNGSDTRLSVLSGICGNLSCIGGDDDGGSGATSLFSFEAEANNFYFIVFDNRWDSEPFAFEISGGSIPLPLVGFERTDISRNGTLRAATDLNSDYLDDIVSISDQTINVQYQNADGSFTVENITTTNADHSPSWSLTAGDLNGDGRNDLIYGGGNGATFMLSDAITGGYEEFSPSEYIFCQRANCVDINNDGLLDAFVCHDVEPNVYFLNEGNETFNYYQGGLGETSNGGNYGSIWIDYDNDGDQDLFIAKCRGGGSDAKINQMHRNNGDGTFTEVGAEINLNHSVQTWSSAWGDYDNDGDMDVFIGASSFSDGSHTLMRNDDSTFVDVTDGSGYQGFQPTSIENTTHDFNNDGFLDIFGAGNTIMINNGDMTFTQSPIEAGNGPIGDLNNDGFLDIVNTGSNGQTRIYFNSGNENNYLKLNTVGTVSNTNGIGARVEVYTAAGKQIRDVRSGDGFRYMSSLNVHFGLGAQTTIDKVIVNWPSGIVDEILAPDINSTLTVVEGAMPSANQEFALEVIQLFPNPVASQLFLPVDLGVEGAVVSIFDVNGKLILNQSLNGNSINLGGLVAGNYQLVYRHADTIRLGKFVKR